MAAVEDDLTRGMVEESFKGAIINLKKIDWLTTRDRWRAGPPQVIFNPFPTSPKSPIDQ